MNEPDLHDTSRWTVDCVLREQARQRPDKTFVRTSVEDLTYSAANERAGRVAAMLSAGGVESGEHVAVMLTNGMCYCEAWLGIARLGAVLVAVNTDYLGRFLVHVLNDSRARVLIVDQDYLERLDAVSSELQHLEAIYVVGEGEGGKSLRREEFGTWRQFDAVRTAPERAYRDLGCIMYTSGTTGPSKGVMMPHAHLYLFGLGTIEHMRLKEDDLFYIVLPLFHANGLFMQLYATMIAGASAYLRERFSAGNWIREIAELGATITNSLGAVAAFVLNQPPSEHDRAHRLRAMGLAPTSEDLVRRLQERFRIPEIQGMYGMTEVNIPLYTPAGAPKGDSCGRVWNRYYDVRILDPDADEELERGSVGEIAVRPRQPFGFMSGYLNMPDKTVEAWRNFWFHTGDAAWMDEDGDVFFVDRLKDCIRRRGENISSFEVENAMAAQPGVMEVAAYAVPSSIEGAEEEVMVALVVDASLVPDAEAAKRHALTCLPPFAVPRYYRFIKELPKTPTGKIQKHLLRRDGVTDDAVDLE